MLPLYKICNENSLPYLGNFLYTPQYLYVRKDKKTGQITEVHTLEKIIHADKFINHIADLSKLPGLRERISMKNLKILTQH